MGLWLSMAMSITGIAKKVIQRKTKNHIPFI